MPLAQKLRPNNLDEFVGQDHLVGKGRPLRTMLEKSSIASMIFWGPPGCGKTTLAKLIPHYIKADFVSYSAIGGSVKDVRAIIKNAKELKENENKETILFVDEIHRFNKAQQDAFLPVVEDGTIILIGATTENPGFSVNSPLLSRARVYRFYSLSLSELTLIANRACEVYKSHKFSAEAIEMIVRLADGDARFVINTVEQVASKTKSVEITDVEAVLQTKSVKYDKSADNHYDTISAFIKSMRGGDADATLHYLARMLVAGEDPLFIARRMLIFASEDIGNAQVAALMVATTCMQAVSMIGLPEAQLVLAQTATYLATAKKSIASTVGLFEAIDDVKNLAWDPIPLHLRNPVNSTMKQEGYGKGHIRYPWLEEKKTGRKIKQEYKPANIIGKKYYRPEEN